jgi:hypothetical protein
MANEVPVTNEALAPSGLLDAERLDVYRVAIEFQVLATALLPGSAPDKARFYAIARGSATECAAILELLLARGLLASPSYRRGRILLVRIIQMLTRLSARADGRA